MLVPQSGDIATLHQTYFCAGNMRTGFDRSSRREPHLSIGADAPRGAFRISTSRSCIFVNVVSRRFRQSVGQPMT